MTETEQLIARIHAMAKKINRSPATLSNKFLGGGEVLAGLQIGKTITLAKYERAMAALDEEERLLASAPPSASVDRAA